MRIFKIVCYGDSNTYGWDPRFYSGDRYDHPWPELTAKLAAESTAQLAAESKVKLAAGQMSQLTETVVVNCGEPGRVVPYRVEYLEWFCRDVQRHKPDLLVIMLGTNDLINMPVPDADSVARSMERMIRFAKQKQLSGKILLLSCPAVFMNGSFYMPALKKLSERYREIAEQEEILYADPFRWNIPMAYDGVHFTEEGHRIFAEEISRIVSVIAANEPNG